jgi:iron-sulfur cluster repair protein YtfE (RIC family)
MKIKLKTPDSGEELRILLRYFETMPFGVVWMQAIKTSHDGELDEDGDELLPFIENLFKDKPEIVSELLQGIVYIIHKHHDTLRGQLEGIIQSIQEVKK